MNKNAVVFQAEVTTNETSRSSWGVCNGSDLKVFDFVLRVKTQNECSWTHHAPSKATGSLMFLSHWSSYLFELQVMWCQRLLTIFRFSNCHYYQPPREKNGGGEIYKLNSVYSIENLMEKKKFYPRKISIFVLQLHRVAFCLDELECAPCGTGSSQV